MRQIFLLRPRVRLVLRHLTPLLAAFRDQFQQVGVLAGAEGDFLEERLPGFELFEFDGDFVFLLLELCREGEVVEPFLWRGGR